MGINEQKGSSMSKEQFVIGMAPGIDLNGAIEDALHSAEGPDEGYEFQTLKIKTMEVIRSATEPRLQTVIRALIKDGSLAEQEPRQILVERRRQ